MTKYRTRIDIVANILEISRKGAKKTHMIYRGNLSFKLAEMYLEAVLKAGFLTFNRKRALYRLTRHGEAFLERYGKYCKFAKDLEKQNERVSRELKLLEKMCFRIGPPNNIGDGGGKVKGVRSDLVREDKVLMEG
jgi:predicted transcriptional regulator